MDNDDLVKYARRASQLGACWARPEHIRLHSECLTEQVRQSKSSLKAAMLVPVVILPSQASVILDQNSLAKSYWTTYASLNKLSEDLIEMQGNRMKYCLRTMGYEWGL